MTNTRPKDTTPEAQDHASPLHTLPGWFIDREIIPLEDHLALVVCHETMRGIVAVCRALAESPRPVLLTGETGVGKSLLCRFLHASRDPESPLVSLLCAGLGKDVLEERLFGGRACPGGLVAEAATGALVLEEMGDLPLEVQEGLLEFWNRQQPGTGPLQFICTTNLPRRTLLTPGRLLPGLLERFRHIHVPPLRERPQDIPALVAYFARQKASRRESLKSLETLAARLAKHRFPGNVRELESLMALETSGLPWRWRVAGPEQVCSVRAR